MKLFTRWSMCKNVEITTARAPFSLHRSRTMMFRRSYSPWRIIYIYIAIESNRMELCWYHPLPIETLSGTNDPFRRPNHQWACWRYPAWKTDIDVMTSISGTGDCWEQSRKRIQCSWAAWSHTSPSHVLAAPEQCPRRVDSVIWVLKKDTSP